MGSASTIGRWHPGVTSLDAYTIQNEVPAFYKRLVGETLSGSLALSMQGKFGFKLDTTYALICQEPYGNPHSIFWHPNNRTAECDEPAVQVAGFLEFLTSEQEIFLELKRKL